jgi:hypothetical protein
VREAELEEGREPLRVQRIAGALDVADDVLEVLADEVRQQEAIILEGAVDRFSVHATS